jgi:hypothetical protein
VVTTAIITGVEIINRVGTNKVAINRDNRADTNKVAATSKGITVRNPEGITTVREITAMAVPTPTRNTVCKNN